MNLPMLPDPRKWLMVAAPVAVAAIPLSFILWRTPAGAAAPPSTVLPFLVAIGVVIPALSFGMGVAFLLLARGLVDEGRAAGLSRAAYFSIGWLLTNWWPHSNFHRVSTGWTNLMLVDYFFHTTVIVASGIVAVFFWRVAAGRLASERAGTEAHAAASTRATGSSS